MKLVIDASVAVKWVVREEGRAEALQRTAGQELLAPDFVLVESANILWKKVRLAQLDAEHARRGLEFIAGAFAMLVPAKGLAPRALAMSMEYDHPVYDCLYLACAEAEEAQLLTADRRLAAMCAIAGRNAIVLGQATP